MPCAPLFKVRLIDQVQADAANMSAVTLAAVAAAHVLEFHCLGVRGTTAKIIMTVAALAIGARASA